MLADRLRITRGEARRRVAEAADLGQRRALTGEVLAPLLTATAAAQRAGRIGADHVRVIRSFLRRLPASVDLETREHAEAHLAELATKHGPEDLAKLAGRLTACLNPDGDYTDEDRARRRGLTLGKQDIDGMSPVRGWLTPEARAALEAVLAKLAAPGMCNPEDDTAVVDGAPGEEAVQRDTRSTAQRNHDGFTAALRGVVGQRRTRTAQWVTGQHHRVHHPQGPGGGCRQGAHRRGHATADERCDPSGPPRPSLPRHFRQGQRAIGLYHTKRLASPGQRIVLYAKDRGCTHPGCDVPGYLSEVHHVTEFAKCRTSNVDDLTFACGQHHPLVKPGGWRTRKLANGTTEWIPPPHLDHGQPRTNTFHHPEDLLRAEDEEG